jgi:hypothetical protein
MDLNKLKSIIRSIHWKFNTLYTLSNLSTYVFLYMYADPFTMYRFMHTA